MAGHHSYKQRAYAVGELLVTLRTRGKFTQTQLADHIGVNRRSIQNWEIGATYPNEDALRRLIATFLEHRVFTSGIEHQEAEHLWTQVRQDAPRSLAPFDAAWFGQLVNQPERQTRALGHNDAPRDRTTEGEALAGGSGLVDWGDALDVTTLYGREDELETMVHWIIADRCRAVMLLGLGGNGKTSLAVECARRITTHFDAVVFRSLRDAPPIGHLLDELIHLLAAHQIVVPDRISEKLIELTRLLRRRRCLLILDNLESILQEGDHAGEFRDGYEAYGTLIQRFGATAHDGCLLVTSREKPDILVLLEGQLTPVRLMRLDGLTARACQEILRARDVSGDLDQYAALARLYGGNPLALNLVSEPIRDLFDGDIGAFLASGDAFFNGMGRLLEQQIIRTSTLEQSLLEWLAIAREPLALEDLASSLLEPVQRGDFLKALEALRRRSLIERTGRGASFTLQPVVMEYVTRRLINDIGRAILQGEPAHLAKHALVQATARDYVRRSQERLIGSPLVALLIATSGGEEPADVILVSLLEGWRGQTPLAQGYGPGNVTNLLRLLHGHLHDVDLSALRVRQAYLQEVEMHDASLKNAQLSETVLAHAFDYSVCSALSADGTILAAGTNSGEVRLWRVADRGALTTARARGGGVYSVAISTDGKLLASGSLDGTIQLWEISSGTCLTELLGHSGLIHDLAMSGDGQLLASASFDKTVRLWNTTTGECLAVLEGHNAMVWGVSMSADGRLIASGSADGTVRLWETATALCSAVLQGHSGGVWDVALSADGSMVASGGVDGTVRLWDTNDGACQTVMRGHEGLILGIALSADGHLVISGGVDGTLRLWNTASGVCQAILQGHTGLIRGVALSGDAQLLASVSFDGTIKLWETSGGRLLATLQGQTGLIWTMAMSADGQLLVSGRSDGVIQFWNTVNGHLTASVQAHAGMVLSASVGADGHLMATGSFDGTIKLWDAVTGTCRATLKGYSPSFPGPVWAVSLSADGRMLASGHFDGILRLWDVTSNNLVAMVQAHDGLVWGVSTSADGHLVATGGFDGAVKLWDSASHALLEVFEGHIGPVWSVAMSANGRRIASSGEDGIVRVWTAGSSYPLATFTGHRGAIFRVALSADGQIVATGGMDGSSRLWHIDEHRGLLTLAPYAGAIWGMALSADRRLVACCTGDGAVRTWDVNSGAVLRTFRSDRLYERMDIHGLSGVTDAQTAALRALGASDAD
jgi:WD40 repeat protein/transcriptional regulator with XRE-family HTH domain